MKKEITLLLFILTVTAYSQTTVFDKNFNDQSITSGGWIQKDVLGGNNWFTSSAPSSTDYYAKISGYSAPNSVANDDWLISPKMNLSSYSSAVLTFRSAYKDINASSPRILEVYITNSYNTSSMPDSASWVKLSPTLSAGNYTWTNSGDVSLSAYTNTSDTAVYIAFRYISTNTKNGTWEVDNIKVVGSTTPNAIKEVSNTPKLNVFPSVASSTVNITYSSPAKSIAVLNMVGQIVYNSLNPTEKIDLSGLSQGNYIIVVDYKNGNKELARIIKK